ncbi:Plasmodium vivax Vir protein, putative [Plasmodium vivax]|nr:Plasmodium vivax Vir protein, putative [Plasmodium vivax]
MAPYVNEFINFPKNILSPDITNRNYVIQNCIRLKNYLLYFKNNNLCDNNKCCGYFNFWLNEIARKDESINETTFTHYKNCTKYYINPIESDKCISEIYYIEDTEFKKKQELYDLYDLYDLYNGFSLNTGEYGKISFSNICPDKYNDLIGNCRNVINDEFCKELINFWNNFLKNILNSNERCEATTIELLPYEDEMVNREEEEEEEEEQKQPQEEGETKKAAHGRVGFGTVLNEEADLAAMEGGTMSSERLASANIPGDSDSEIFVEHQNSNTHKPIGTIIGTSLGFFIPLTMLYKFTPLGNWVNTRVLGRDKLMDNMKKNELEFLLNSAQTQEMNSGDIKYRIKYNSVLNE